MSLHLNTPKGPKEITPDIARALVEQGRLKPDLKALSVDGGKTWVSYQTLAAKSATSKAPSPAPAAPVPAKTDDLFQAPAGQAAPAPATAEPIPLTPTPAEQLQQATASAAPDSDSPYAMAEPAATVRPVATPVMASGVRQPDSGPQSNFTLRPGRSQFGGTMLYGMLLLLLLFVPTLQEKRINPNEPRLLQYRDERLAPKTETKAVFPHMVTLLHLDSVAREADKRIHVDVEGMSMAGGTAFLIIVGGMLTLMGGMCQERKVIAIFTSVAALPALAMLFGLQAIGSAAGFGGGLAIMMMGLALAFALAMTWDDVMRPDTRRMLCVLAGVLMLLGATLPMTTGGAGSTYLTTAFGKGLGEDASGFLRFSMIATLLMALATAGLLLAKSLDLLAGITRWSGIGLFALTGLFVILLLMAVAAEEIPKALRDQISGAMRFNLVMGVIQSVLIFGMIPLALVHVLRGSSEAREARRAELQKAIASAR
jgi:hypothetical protein